MTYRILLLLQETTVDFTSSDPDPRPLVTRALQPHLIENAVCKDR